MHIVRNMLSVSLVLLLAACATTEQKPVSTPFDALEELSDPAVRNDTDAFMQHLYAARAYVPHKQLKHDPIALSKQSEAPINNAQAKIIGPSYQDSLRSLAAKIWMIENAEYTLDLTYYIYKYDPTGYALIGALCNAVKRGVDIRIMVDSLGSMSSNHAPMRALETCTKDAGYMRGPDGQETSYKARVQFVIINALTSWRSWSNRRSHDKLIIKDGSFPGKDMVMTGGRNISVDYYGINKDGSRNKDTYLDLEILLRSDGGVENSLSEITVGDVSSVYYTLLFLHNGNRRIYPISNEDDDSAFGLLDPYASYRQKAQESLAFIKNVPAIKEVYEEMPEYLNSGYRSSEVRLAHELGNLVSTDVVTDVVEIKSRNTNSIEAILANAVQEAEREDELSGTLRIISPYLFIAQYKNKEGQVFYDGAQRMLEMLEQYPELSFEIVTNSVLTSDNFFTQSVIDMDTAPRLLLSEEMRAIWLKNRKDSEYNPGFVNSDEWVRLINHPRIGIYQTGLLDSALIGGTESYGKLHAKTFFDDNFGFVGTSNFDYRSRLYNNEMGFYFVDPGLANDLNKVFEELKSISLRWGSPEWLEMRKKLIESGGFKGYTTATQRGRYMFLKSTGLIWLF